MRIYYNANTGKYIFSFAGTDPNDPKDVETDVRQSRGLRTDQYDKVAKLGHRILKKIQDGQLDKNMISATGQSLGGGEAALFGAIVKCETKTFNAAGVHENTLVRAEVKDYNFSNITNYTSAGDILTYIQEDATKQDLDTIEQTVQDVDDIPILGDIAMKVGQDKVEDKLSGESLKFISERLKYASDINQELPDALGTRVNYGSQERVNN